MHLQIFALDQPVDPLNPLGPSDPFEPSNPPTRRPTPNRRF
jgi:hypothetical protein